MSTGRCATEANRFWQDRQAMKAGNFTGISGFPNQDVAMWLSMGADRRPQQDRLGASDLAIVEFRRRCSTRCRLSQDGGNAIGTGADAVRRVVCSFQAIVPKTTDWRDTGVPRLARPGRRSARVCVRTVLPGEGPDAMGPSCNSPSPWATTTAPARCSTAASRSTALTRSTCC
jgi:hypothetical protein